MWDTVDRPFHDGIPMTTASSPPLPPGPRGWLPGGQVLPFRMSPLTYLTRMAREHGDHVLLRLGPELAVLVSHPDSVREVLVVQDRKFRKGRGLERTKPLLGEGLLTSEGEFHRRQRRLVNPAFHHERIAAYGRVMTEYAERASGTWRDGQELDLSEAMMRLTLAIVARTLFGADVEGEAGEIGAALTTVMNGFPLMMLPLSDWILKLPVPPIRRLFTARDRLEAFIYRMIEERRREGGAREDLLSMLLDARDEEGESGDGAGMSDRQVRDEAMTLLLAGHETTANALGWTWYLLATHPDAEARLRAELDAVLSGRPPAPEDLPKLVFTERVLSESMRLYPPAWVIGRRALEDVEIGGYRIPKGALVLVSPYVVQRDARWYPDPLRFDPDRWTDEARALRSRFAYFPFAGGSRQCIGEGFAWMEGILLIASIARHWTFRLAPDAVVEPHALVTLRPRRGIRARAFRLDFAGARVNPLQ